jgi:hypothetical protein
MDYTKDEIIKDLTEKLIVAEQLKKSEILRNKDLLEIIEKQDLYIDTLRKINENFSNKICKLQIRLKNIVLKIDERT